MSKDNVNISLEHYNRLVNAVEIEKRKHKGDIECLATRKAKELMKHTILVKKTSGSFRNGYIEHLAEIITNDDALKMSVDKLEDELREYHDRMEVSKVKETKYKEAIDRMENLKWYDLLFGTKKSKQ